MSTAKPSADQMLSLMLYLEDYADEGCAFYAGILSSLLDQGVRGVRLAIARSTALGKPGGKTARENGYVLAFEVDGKLVDLDGEANQERMLDRAWRVAREQAGNGHWIEEKRQWLVRKQAPDDIDPLDPAFQREFDAVVEKYVSKWQQEALDKATPTARAKPRRRRL